MSMTGQQYVTTQMRLIEIGRLAETLDLDEFIKAIENAETAGAVLDPEQFLKASVALNAAKCLAQAVQPVKAVYQGTFRDLMKTMAVGFAKDKTGNKNA